MDNCSEPRIEALGSGNHVFIRKTAKTTDYKTGKRVNLAQLAQPPGADGEEKQRFFLLFDADMVTYHMYSIPTVSRTPFFSRLAHPLARFPHRPARSFRDF